MNKKGLMVILSAPSGCGKDTVFHELSNIRHDICESVSATTRQPRIGEVDGVNYFFMSNEEFEKMIENNEFLEYANYNNCYYGTPKKAATQMVQDGKICFLIIECQGAHKVMKNCPEAVSIFLMPPSLETLEGRLRKRNTDSEQQILNRLKIANEEIDSASDFNYIVVNNELEKVVKEINEILNNELKKHNA